MSLVCSTCRESLPENNFSRDKTSGRGYAYNCKPCHNRYSREKWYPKNREKQLQATRISNEKSLERNKQYILDYLINHSCVDCGESDPIVLEFDHVTGTKKFEISKGMSIYTLSRIIEEINKCEIRCANCHRRKTAKDLGWWRAS